MGPGIVLGVVPDEALGVELALVFGIEFVKPLIRIDCHDHVASTGVRQSLGVSVLDVVENGSLQAAGKARTR